ALPPTTVRQLGSHQLITDPSSAVKELIDNALDARAKSIFVDIASNTIDFIQVKDDGHGIPSEDRALACRRYCTSKIRDFHDLKEAGRKWLGFRGEALASMADMSDAVLITTRVEGEQVAVKLTYQRNGELTKWVVRLLESARVRRDLVIKNSVKSLAKTRRLIQAYALARPAVRFRLHVLKAKNNKGDFVYAPKADANVEDAAFKVIGKDCALQCDWTALEMSGYELHAFLPKPAATASKIANHGAFISVDSRPVSATRGTLKKIALAVRSRLRKAHSTLSDVKDPFFCLNIICPVDSYDPNVEPAKDDVIFGDESLVITLVDRLLISYYPENISNSTEEIQSEKSVIMQSGQDPDAEPSSQTLSSIHQDSPSEELNVPIQQPRWRSSMYGIDEEDLEFLQQNNPVAIEEEEDCRDISISNPWTIARMNAPVKSRGPTSNRQLLSPAKSQEDANRAVRSPTPVATPGRSRLVEPLTPQTMSQANVHRDTLDGEQLRSTQHLNPLAASENVSSVTHSGPRPDRALEHPSFDERMSFGFCQPAPQASTPDSSFQSFTGPTEIQTNLRSRRGLKTKSNVSLDPQSNVAWFGQPMRNAPKAARPQKRSRQKAPPVTVTEDSFGSRYSLVLPAAERLTEPRLASKNNTDIREFFGKSRRVPDDVACSPTYRNRQPQDVLDQPRAHVEQDSPMEGSSHRSKSADPYERPTVTAREMNAVFALHQNTPPSQMSSSARVSNPIDTAQPTRPVQRLQRRRTADTTLHRTKSSTLPLNSTPLGSETHNLSLTINTSVSSIEQYARKLDMTANSLEWGYDSTDAFDVFGTPVSERTIMQWVVRVDGLLHASFERVEGVEARGALHEGVQRFLDTRREQRERGDRCAIVAAGGQEPVAMERDGMRRDTDGVPEPGGEMGRDMIADWVAGTATADSAIESDDCPGGMDLSPLVELDGDARQGSPVLVIKAEDDFGDGIDDEMLMDL
ncbi:hypothetical protein C7974DRAFT_451680, partial [Boeremia exigua]|uniref:uncharacterized protein n=1 Tax=Boeremia exigua TaxID=749465 RepID=UPI001E8E32E6